MIVRWRLLQAIAENGLTMNKLRRSGISSIESYASKTRPCSPSVTVLRDMCLRLDCSADWLLGLSETRERSGSVALMPEPKDVLREAGLRCDAVSMYYERRALLHASSDYARRKRVPRASTYERVAMILGCSVDSLLGLEEQ